MKDAIFLLGRGKTLQHYIQGMINQFSKKYHVLVMDSNDISYYGDFERIQNTRDTNIIINDDLLDELCVIEKDIKLNLYDSYSSYFYYGRLAQECNIRYSSYWKSKEQLIVEYYSYYVFFKNLFDSYNIKFIYHDTIDLISTQIIEALSKKYNISFYHTFISPGIFNNRRLLGTGIKRLNYLFYKNMQDNIKPTDKEKSYVYNILETFKTKKPKMAYLEEVSQSTLTLNELKKLFFKTKNIIYAIRRVLNRMWLKKKSKDFHLNKCGDYILYFMHHQPEATTTSNSQDFADQWKIVEEMSIHAPSHINIVIKPHPFGYGWQGKKYYEKLVRLPNVYLAPIGYDGKELIQNAKAAVTINGSLALEAMIYKTPSYVLDTVWYNYNNMIERLSHPRDILDKLDSLRVISDEDIERVLLGIYRSSVDFYISYADINHNLKVESGENLSRHILEHKDIYFNREIPEYETRSS